MDALVVAAARLAAVFVLTLVSGFFVASEYALITIRKTRVDELVDEGRRPALALRKLLDELTTLLAATQLGVTLVSLLLGALAEPAVARTLEPLFGLLPSVISRSAAQLVSVALAFLAVTSLDIIVGELAPKSIGLRYNERVAMLAVGPMRAFIWVFRPLITVLEAGGQAVAGLVGARSAEAGDAAHSPDELKRLIAASTTAGVLDRDEEEMLIRVLELSRLTVRQIMVPRTEMVAVRTGITFSELLGVIAREPYTRLPVYDGSLDNIIGVVSVRDFLHRRDELERADFDVRRVMRPPLTVPETIRVDSLLQALRQQRAQIAFAVDEFGGIAGLVTLEDLLERIIGEVPGDYQAAPPEIQMLAGGVALVDGLALIDDVNTRFGLHLDDSNYDTIGGYVFGELGRRPAIGDEIAAEGWTIRVADLDGLRISRVELRPPAVELEQAKV
jgi:CBS domain containing-hemolysin-like protein